MKHASVDRPVARRAAAAPARTIASPWLAPAVRAPALTYSTSEDACEHEADRVAAQVLAAPAQPDAAGVARRVQRPGAHGSGPMQIAPPRIGPVLAASGASLEPVLRREMEQRFAYDFSNVRVHADANAAQSAADVNAAAFTVGRDIVFGTGRFAPGTREGRQLLAHELTHVVQQRSGKAGGTLLQRQPLGGGGPGGADDEAALLWESFRQSLTLDGFDSDKATLQPDHVTRIDDFKKRFQVLLGRYPDSLISVIGHTDATDTEGHNQALGQRRADAVKDALTTGDYALPAQIMHAGSLGETMLAVETKGREPRNRRVEIIPRLRRLMKLPAPPASSPPLPGFGGAGQGGKEPDDGRGPGRPGPGTDIPGGPGRIPDLKIPPRNWFEEGLKNDPIIKELPEWMRKKVIDALKDGDELIAEKVIDALPLDGKTKAAVQAIAKSILQLAKGKKFKMPEAPPPVTDPSRKPDFPKMPGEVIVPGPTFKF